MRLASHERRLIRRYLFPGRTGGFALLVAAIGCAGVAIGVAALVLVVSFMNGAEARLAGQIASADGHVFVTSRPQALGRWSGMEGRLRRTAGVVAVTSSAHATGLVTVDGRAFGADLQGIDPADMASLPVLQRGSAALVGRAPLAAGTVALGMDLASRLGVGPGDHAAITMPRFVNGDLTVANYDVVVTGVIGTDVDAFDSRRVVMPMSDLRAIVGPKQAIGRINVWLARPDRQEAIVSDMRRQLGRGFTLTTWRDMNVALFAALAQERLAMAVVVSLVTLIALTNIMSSMVMLVRHKAREIAILRTMGMTHWSVAKVFIGVGAVIGLAGEAAGLAIGLGLKAVKNPVSEAVRAQLTRPSMEMDVLLSLPLSISMGEVGWIVALVTTGVIVSATYPALRAAAVDPAAVLRGS